MTAPVVAHIPIISRVLDIPSPLSPSSLWVRVSVSVRRCCRFSGLYAFHSSDSVPVGIAYNVTASSTLALLQCTGHWAYHIRSKPTSEDDTGVWGTGSEEESDLVCLLLWYNCWLSVITELSLIGSIAHYALSHSHCASWCQRQPRAAFALLTKQ